MNDNLVREILHRSKRIPRAYLLCNIKEFTDDDVRGLMPLLPAWRRDVALAFRHEQGRKECVLSYVLLREILREEYGMDEPLEFEYMEHGKPLLANHPEIHFSLSHCRTAVACAVDSKPIGIDVESRGRYKETVARHVLSDEEMATVLDAEDRDCEFLKLWTCKEAVLKLTGEGVGGDMKDVLSSYPEIRLTTAVEADCVWTVAELQPV